MEALNAFIGKLSPPAETDIETVLGNTTELWRDLIHWFADLGVAEQEWKSTSPKYGWSLRLKIKKRTIIYLAPCHGCFRAAFVLGDRAVEAARKISLPKKTLQLLNEAPRYAEGTGLRLIVKEAKDLSSIRKIASVKLAN
jgi:hypothetical protein